MKFRFLSKIDLKKKSTIAFIIFWAVLIIIGLIVLDYGSKNKFGLEVFTDEYRHTVGVGSTNNYNYSHSAADISEIDIRWQSGKVELKLTDSEEFRITEVSSKELDHSNRLIIEGEEGVLLIKWDEQTGIKEFLRGQYDKDLLVEIPKDLNISGIKINTVYGEVNLSEVISSELKITSVTAPMKLRKCKAYEMKLKSDSGLIDLEEVMAEDMKVTSNSGDIKAKDSVGSILKLDSVSGNIEFFGSFEKIKANSADGLLDLSTDVLPKQVDMGSVSGEIRLCIPEDSDLPVTLKSVSGEIKTDFEKLDAENFVASEKEAEDEDEEDEESFLNIRTTSGDIKLIEGEKSKTPVEIFPEESEDE